MSYKLLIVDDEKDIVESLKSKLLRENYDVVVAFDGDEALAKVREEDPDIIILDLIMPKLNGFDVLRELKLKHNDKWRPVIIISVKDDLESLKRSYNLEADHYLTKPCSVEQILTGIETMISLIPIRSEKV